MAPGPRCVREVAGSRKLRRRWATTPIPTCDKGVDHWELARPERQLLALIAQSDASDEIPLLSCFPAIRHFKQIGLKAWLRHQLAERVYTGAHLSLGQTDMEASGLLERDVYACLIAQHPGELRPYR